MTILRAMISKQIVWQIHYIFDQLGSGLLSFFVGLVQFYLKSLVAFIAFECAAVTLFLTQKSWSIIFHLLYEVNSGISSCLNILCMHLHGKQGGGAQVH